MTFDEWISDKDFIQYIEECEYYALQKLCFEAGFEEGAKEQCSNEQCEDAEFCAYKGTMRACNEQCAFDGWYYPSKGKYPELRHLPDGSNYSPLVLVFWWGIDVCGCKNKVYDVDYWYPELNKWAHYNNDVVAWQYLPESPKED